MWTYNTHVKFGLKIPNRFGKNARRPRGDFYLTHVVKQSTDFMGAYYGCKAACSSMTECRQQLWACTKKQESQQHQNCVFCHQQLKHWAKCLQSTLSGCLVVQCPEWRSSYSQWCGLQNRWKADEANKCPIPRNMAGGVLYAPEQILKLVYGLCFTATLLRANCGCMGHQLPYTTLCACSGGLACLNPF